MSTLSLETTVAALLAAGKGILAADETVGTISKRDMRKPVREDGSLIRIHQNVILL